MKKNLIIFILTILSYSNITSQTTITSDDINAQNAGEGDLYIHNNVIYIGLTDGSYHPINKNLEEILTQANDAGTKKISNLGVPTAPNDAATKAYVDNLTGGGSWNLTGNSGTSNSNFIGTTDAQDFVLKSNNSEKLRLVNNKGQVLINQATSFNSHPLVIKANGVDVLAFEDASGTPKWHWNLLANGLNFVESNVLDYRLFLENGGNIGINTSNPAAKLHIAGDMQLDNAFKDKDGDVGGSGQILSSTTTGTDWITNISGNNIYNTDGQLTANRNLDGQNNTLWFKSINSFRINSTSSLLYSSNDTQINTTAGYTQLWGASGILFHDNSTFEENIWLKKELKDTSGDSGASGQVLSSTNTGTNWQPLISADTDNALTVGSDKGTYRKTSHIQLYSDESTTTENWNNNEKTVASHKITITEQSIINISYVFSFERTNEKFGKYRAVNIDISGTTIKNNQMSSITNTYNTAEKWATCAANRSYQLNPGTYTISMKTFGTHKCSTEAQNDSMYGWSFDVTTIPTTF